MTVLSIKEVSFSYTGNGRSVLDRISVSFDQGNMYAIVGESGSGKTTLLSLMAGLTGHSTGEIMYKGSDMRRIDKDRYRSSQVGVIFQSYNLLLADTAADNVMLSIQLGGSRDKDKRRLAYELLAKVGIDRDKADRKVLKLSGGEQQRVAIARSMSCNPGLIIADEPTGNLDERNTKAIMNILQNLAHAEGKCVILVTHSAAVTEYADFVLELADGRLRPRAEATDASNK